VAAFPAGGGCVRAELTAAAAVPEAIARQRVSDALKAPQEKRELKLSPMQPAEGRQAKLQREKMGEPAPRGDQSHEQRKVAGEGTGND
jgi:hypothetical protein